MTPTTPPAPRRSHTLALFFGVLFLSLFAWSGTLHTSDGLAMYAVSDSLVRYGTWDIENIRWMGLQQGTFGPDGLLYSRKGLAVSILALPLVWVGYQVGNMGAVHAATLLTPILHALTAVYLYRTVRVLMPASHPRTALWVAGLWAFGSMAFAYVKTWFSEPAVALTMIAALYHLLAWRETRNSRSLLAVGLWLGVSLLTRSANAIVFPFYGLALLAIELQHFQQSRRAPLQWSDATAFIRASILPVLWFLAPIVVSGVLYLAYNALRFGDPFDSGYIEGEEFSAVWWEGIWGQTLSPGRGLLWYTPWLLLSVVGAWQWRRKAPLVVAVAWGSVLTYILVYGKWYLWSGGFAWGPRFLVPILPLLALLTAPVLEQGKRWRGVWWLLALVGVAVNLIGVLYDFNLYQAWLESLGQPIFAWESFADPAYAQIPNLLRLGLENFNNIDLAWVVTNDRGASLRSLGTLSVIVLLGLGMTWWLSRRSPRLMEQVGVGVVTLFLLGWLLTDVYAIEQREWLALPAYVSAQGGGDTPQLWYDSPPLAAVVMNQVKGTTRITGFFVDGADLDADTAPRAAALATTSTAPIYLLSDGPPRAANGLDRLLTAQLAWVEDNPVAPSGILESSPDAESPYRVTTYWQGPLSEPITYDLPFTFADGTTIVLRSAQVTPSVAGGNVLALQLQWEAQGALSPTTQVFVQLTSVEATLPIIQKDSALAQETVDVTTLSPAQVVTDRHALRLNVPMMDGVTSEVLANGNYLLRFGLYQYDTLERATLPDGSNDLTIPILVTP